MTLLGTPGYDREKFQAFDHKIDYYLDNDAPVFVVDHPEELGDTYLEVVINLSKIANAGMELAITKPSVLYQSPEMDNPPEPRE